MLFCTKKVEFNYLKNLRNENVQMIFMMRNKEKMNVQPPNSTPFLI